MRSGRRSDLGAQRFLRRRVSKWATMMIYDVISMIFHYHYQWNRQNEENAMPSPCTGRNLAEANAPAIVEVPDGGRLLVLAFASPTSGVPRHWAADARTPGVNLLPSLSEAAVGAIAERLAEIRRPGDVVVASLHWGPNWGYSIPEGQRRFAHALIDEAQVSVVHGHSSHHPKAIEVYHDRLILYGCGDFLNDYEGIAGYEEYRGDLSLMYFADVDPVGGRLRALDIRRFRSGDFGFLASRAKTSTGCGGRSTAKARGS